MGFINKRNANEVKRLSQVHITCLSQLGKSVAVNQFSWGNAYCPIITTVIIIDIAIVVRVKREWLLAYAAWAS
eukprot:1691373-Pyramimonas_sp.AAC.1